MPETFTKGQPRPIHSRWGPPKHFWLSHPHSSSGFSNETAPLFGGISSIGLFFANVFLGGQAARVQLDTGSSTLAVFASELKPAALIDIAVQLDALSAVNMQTLPTTPRRRAWASLFPVPVVLCVLASAARPPHVWSTATAPAGPARLCRIQQPSAPAPG